MTTKEKAQEIAELMVRKSSMYAWWDGLGTEGQEEIVQEIARLIEES